MAITRENVGIAVRDLEATIAFLRRSTGARSRIDVEDDHLVCPS